LKFGGLIPGYGSTGLYIGFLPSFIHSAFNSMVCVMPSAERQTQIKQQVRKLLLHGANKHYKECDRASGRSPPGFLPVLRGVLMVGLGSVVSVRADSAAECWAFLMLVPSASQC